MEQPTVWTIGHSTRPAEDLVAILQAHRIEAVADVRRYPGSRRHPQFGGERLAATLAAAGIEYQHLPGLGGRREALPDSPNTAWRNAGFRGYADHMASSEWQSDAAGLLALAERRRTAVMCAEAVWWRCHRGLIADWLKARGVRVLHILDEGPGSEHPYTKAARLVEGRLDYGGSGGGGGDADTGGGGGQEPELL